MMFIKWNIFIVLTLVSSAVHGFSDTDSAVQFSDGRIVNGRDAKDGEFPYQVSIQMISWSGDSSSHICGGSIIDEYHVLTAAHCVDGKFTDELLVVAGVRNISLTTDVNRVNLTLAQIYVHKDFNFMYYFNDIAVVRLAERLPTDSSYIQPITMRMERLQTPATCIVSGWGSLFWTPQTLPDILQTVSVPFVDYDMCEELYKDYPRGYFIPGMLCAGYIQGEKDACKGDSGGPLVCGGQLTGIVSWGEECAVPYYPGIYADVAFYKEWIQETLTRSYVDGGLPFRIIR